eukprot:CAMPEP_0170075372 /NCGR_PEP_ID=MMETSP0019_2-20121128/12518_1 /TAXON_ID=98059 /ORGANISM="Dinobryon sp., Strain UTEXLB2267" /LENGTH=52 /DNA_ID=CAMNT_0010286293 /DNA_START=61 /DNA_END=216 /DNA_ORIENTATION=-
MTNAVYKVPANEEHYSLGPFLPQQARKDWTHKMDGKMAQGALQPTATNQKRY